MDFSCHRLWGYYEFQMHFLSCQWGGKMRLALRRFAAAPVRVIASLGGATLNHHQEELLVCTQCGSSSPGSREPARGSHVTSSDFCISPLFRPRLRGAAMPVHCWRCFHNQLDLTLWKGDRTLWVQGCHLKPLFPTFSCIILVCRILGFLFLA